MSETKMRTNIFDFVSLSRRSAVSLCGIALFITCVAYFDVSKLSGRHRIIKIEIQTTLHDDLKDSNLSNSGESGISEHSEADLPGREAKTKVIILFWTGYWIWSHFGWGVGNRGFVQAGCPLQNCHTTTNRNKLRGADAVVFHGEDLGNEKLLQEMETLKKFRKSRRDSGQKTPIFVYFMKEPPHQGNKLNDPVYKDFFDLTITYQPDSDVEAAYGTLVPIKAEDDPSWPRWRQFSATNEILNRNIDFKTKDIAWIVSHCETDSHREQYVEALMKATTLKVDVFGSCGHDSLPLPPRPEESEYERQSVAQVSTYRDTLRPYKFYLSFENTLCKSYITEKFFYTFASEDGPIPVAFGGLSTADYGRVAPPHSYLHVDNFSSPDLLAKELERLSSNATAYNEYFWWQKFYKLETEWDNHVKAQCKLCNLLNKILTNDYQARHYEDMTKFFNIQSRCRSPTI